jgi:HSP20 family molecular chaperone IbpA
VSEELRASFKDGVLSIELPKKEEVKPRQISIK